jgi:hypothetical protein
MKYVMVEREFLSDKLIKDAVLPEWCEGQTTQVECDKHYSCVDCHIAHSGGRMKFVPASAQFAGEMEEGLGAVMRRIDENNLDGWTWLKDISSEIDALLSEIADTKWQIGQTVIYRGEKRMITDVDLGYCYLALDGDCYITPDHPENRCISAPMHECNLLSKISAAKEGE